MKRFIALLCAFVMVFSLCACAGNGDGGETTETKGVTVIVPDITAKPSDTYISTENFRFTVAEATYGFSVLFNSFYSLNANYLSFYGIDVNETLKTQEYSEDMSWFEYFAEQLQGELEAYLIYCEAAKAADFEMTEEMKKSIDDIIDEMNQFAVDYAYEPEYYIKLNYGDIVTEADIRSYLEKVVLATHYSEELYNSYTFTEADEDKYLAEHRDEFEYVDFIGYTMTETLDREASVNAKELMDTASEDDFYAYIENYEANVIKKEVGCLNYDYYTRLDNELSEWAFSAEIGDRFIYSDALAGQYTVCLMKSKPAIQEYNVRDFRCIELSTTEHSTFEGALEKANEIVDEWKAGEATAESFSAFAKKYSEDENAESGGVYARADKSTPILTDESVEWLFGEAQIGEVAVFEKPTGYIILYYENEGRVQWRVQAYDSLFEEAYMADMEKFEKAYEISFEEDMIWQIDK